MKPTPQQRAIRRQIARREGALPQPTTPAGSRAKRGYARNAVRVYDARCSTCEGKGWIRDLSGAQIDCPRCAE